MLEHTSTYINATFPYSLTFGPNYFIHGWPSVASTSVAEDFDRDCLRLESHVAESLYTYVQKSTPVVVHAPTVEKKELFSFESRVPNFSTPQYLIADLKSDMLLAVGNKHTARPIASLTKLMTALVVLDNLPLDRLVSVETPSLIETLVPRLQDRNKVSVHALLQLLLVESSNEAAEVLAEAVGREEFIAQMNEQAAKLGMVDTHFTDPSGVDAGNVSTVHDLWWLTRYIYDHYPLIFTFTRNDQAPPAYVSDAFADLINFNKVEFVDSFVGGKIGETTAAGQTSVTLHRLQINGEERDIGIILLGSTGRRADVVKLLQYIGDRFEP